MDELTPERFAPLVGDVFRVRGPAGVEAPFELLEARDLGPAMDLPDGYRRPFSLLFRAPDDVAWGHGTFAFCHDALGELPLFCTAVIDPGGHGRHAYEVVIA